MRVYEVSRHFSEFPNLNKAGFTLREAKQADASSSCTLCRAAQSGTLELTMTHIWGLVWPDTRLSPEASVGLWTARWGRVHCAVVHMDCPSGASQGSEHR